MSTTTAAGAAIGAMDEHAIIEVIEAYFGSWFEGDARRMEAPLHPSLAKRGASPGSDGDGLGEDTAATVVEATAEGHGMRYFVEQRGIEIRLNDVYGSNRERNHALAHLPRVG